MTLLMLSHRHEEQITNKVEVSFSLPCIKCGRLCAFADDSTFSISRKDSNVLGEALDSKYQDISIHMAANKFLLIAYTDIVICKTDSTE